MTAETVMFWVLAVPLVVTALGVVVARSPVYAAMNLVAAFFFMAGLYVLLTAHLIAFMQVLVYAGAVMVLFLFVIMLISLGDEHLFPARKTGMQYLGFLGAVLFTDYLLPFEATSLLLLVAIVGAVVVAKERI